MRPQSESVSLRRPVPGPPPPPYLRGSTWRAASPVDCAPPVEWATAGGTQVSGRGTQYSPSGTYPVISRPCLNVTGRLVNSLSMVLSSDDLRARMSTMPSAPVSCPAIHLRDCDSALARRQTPHTLGTGDAAMRRRLLRSVRLDRFNHPLEKRTSRMSTANPGGRRLLPPDQPRPTECDLCSRRRWEPIAGHQAMPNPSLLVSSLPGIIARSTCPADSRLQTSCPDAESRTRPGEALPVNSIHFRSDHVPILVERSVPSEIAHRAGLYQPSGSLPRVVCTQMRLNIGGSFYTNCVVRLSGHMYPRNGTSPNGMYYMEGNPFFAGTRVE